MNLFLISWNSLKSNKLTGILNILLITFGTGILTILLLVSKQIGDKLENNSKNVDLVVGAKGSPLQLILSSVFYIDFPTGNIPLKEAEALSRNPFVSRAVPLALGDNYGGFRIVGTDSNFISMYELQISSGRYWRDDLEVVVGVNVAKEKNTKIGDLFFGSHGLGTDTDVHENHAYKVTGILTPQGNVTDNLILTNVSSVWKMHDQHEKDEADDEHHMGRDNDKHHEAEEVETSSPINALMVPSSGEKEITSLLIQYKNPMAVIMFPKMVNRSTNMQSASPALETARLFSLIGVGVDTLEWFALLIMGISAVSVFISLFNSLKERKYDLAIMRTLGASRIKLSFIVFLEGIILTFIGSIIGLCAGHLALYFVTQFQESSQARLSASILLTEELYILAVGLGIGIIASLIPAFQAYRSDISKILSKN